MAAASEASQQANRSGMDPKRLVVIFFLIAGLIFALFLEHVCGLIWARAGWSDPVIIDGVDWTVSTLVGFLLAAGLVVGAYVHPKTHVLSLEVASVVAAVLLFCIDTLAYNLMVEWIPAIWGKL